MIAFTFLLWYYSVIVLYYRWQDSSGKLRQRYAYTCIISLHDINTDSTVFSSCCICYSLVDSYYHNDDDNMTAYYYSSIKYYPCTGSTVLLICIILFVLLHFDKLLIESMISLTIVLCYSPEFPGITSYLGIV